MLRKHFNLILIDKNLLIFYVKLLEIRIYVHIRTAEFETLKNGSFFG